MGISSPMITRFPDGISEGGVLAIRNHDLRR